MLLAKVYMTLASDTDLGDGKTEPEYWQLAYDEAIKLKNSGKYFLHTSFEGLFTVDGENSTESIFEYQLSETASNNQMGRNLHLGDIKKELMLLVGSKFMRAFTMPMQLSIPQTQDWMELI